MKLLVHCLCNIIIFTNMNQALFLLSKQKSNNLLIFLDFIENVIQLNIGDVGYQGAGFRKEC